MATFFHKLGVERAIIQAPMAGVSTPEMAAAVSNAGGLGSIAVGAVSAEGARDMTTNINAGGFFSMSDMRSAAHLIRAAFCSRVVLSRVI